MEEDKKRTVIVMGSGSISADLIARIHTKFGSNVKIARLEDKDLDLSNVGGIEKVKELFKQDIPWPDGMKVKPRTMIIKAPEKFNLVSPIVDNPSSFHKKWYEKFNKKRHGRKR